MKSTTIFSLLSNAAGVVALILVIGFAIWQYQNIKYQEVVNPIPTKLSSPSPTIRSTSTIDIVVGPTEFATASATPLPATKIPPTATVLPQPNDWAVPPTAAQLSQPANTPPPPTATVAAGSDSLANFCLTVTEIPQVECEALVILYQELDGERWRHGSGWFQNNTPCSWNRKIISCSEQNITGLFMPGEGLTGDMPPEIGDLTELTALNLIGNNLSSIPPEIGRLTNLAYLDLGANNLSSVSQEIGRLINLTYLSLGNNLSGVPPEIGNLTNLNRLFLGGNNLSLPSEIGRLTSLTHLGLNGVTTTLPAEIWTLTNLTYLNLSGSNLAILSPEIGNLTNLAELHLADNEITALPPEIGNLVRLNVLDLRHNNLTSLPPEICTAFQNITLWPKGLCSH
ncbi:MAG: hypothetical protein QNJ45_13500 [Ardenticatenaceae bacterium]|nr:hypothetical protein [Ardenticatenaceae bacterium]